ncbi:MAG: alpha-mannosidase [Candidatus Hydrogenedentes bacterium]|nr:alpha-mannosidase [Candidatus Hydrogenedentota bacterium]
MNRLHMICNAHLDPVWQWEWEEGAAEAISTFRHAADFCETFDGFVFNHNEVTLYRWVEEYEPELFTRIQRLVAAGKWHIMGGWYLQPDCNMPSGESFVRQILIGRRYFLDKFGVQPSTAINFDPFGHNRGLVQIVAKSGYDSYLFCRPNQNDCVLETDDFTWVGFDGSEITGHRASTFYNNSLGKAREKIENWMNTYAGKQVGIVLWGIGNHGGGPSRIDLERLAELQAECAEYQILHSTPENYFRELRASGATLPRHETDINPWGPGCYTSQVRIKQKHRLLENMLYQTEKMLANAALQGLVEYPREDLAEALRDLLVAEFHDILPGSSIQPVEEMGFRLMDHGLEILSRIRARAFFALASGQPKANEGEIPILVYSPHPFPVRAVVECEFQLQDAIWEEQFTVATVHQDGVALPTQIEKEFGNLALDWRKRTVFTAELAPSQMNRFDCTLTVLPKRPLPALVPEAGAYRIKTDDLEFHIKTATGRVDKFAANGYDYCHPDAFKLLVIRDNDDPWETQKQSFREVMGAFELMTAEDGTRFSGVTGGTIQSVRAIEDGGVRTVIEAIFRYGDSFAIIQYKIPKHGCAVEVTLRVHWNEKSKMLKLAVPTVWADAGYCGQVAYGVQEFPTTGRELVAQKWVAAYSMKDDKALTVINDGSYGSDCAEGEIRLSLLRSAAYAAHPIGERPLVLQDRYTERIDQGERLYRFWFTPGARADRLQRVDREALARNEVPFAISFNPSGHGVKPLPGVTLSDDVVQMTALKLAEASDHYVIRLFEPTGTPRSTTLRIPAANVEKKIQLGTFEIKTILFDSHTKTLRETDLLEK